MKNNIKITKFLAHEIKIANRRQKAINHIAKLQRKASAIVKPICGGHSELPTDVDWDKVYSQTRTNRFYEDKLCKGQNACISEAMCNL